MDFFVSRKAEANVAGSADAFPEERSDVTLMEEIDHTASHDSWLCCRCATLPPSAESSLDKASDSSAGSQPVPRPRLSAVSAGTQAMLLFPMYVMPLANFLELTSVEAHQDLLAQGRVVEYNPSMGAAVFLSHQWCGLDHPDPHFEQLPAIQDALKGILNGSVGVQVELLGRICFGLSDGDSLSKSDLKELRSGYVWYDYFSVPQLVARSPDQAIHADLQAAVDSIPAYVQLAKFFMVGAPPTRHANIPGALVDYHSWRARGWCRLERAARVLATDTNRMIVVRGRKQAMIACAAENLLESPVTGQFSVESDRKRVADIMRALVASKLRASIHEKDLHDYRFFLSLRRVMCGDALLQEKGARPRAKSGDSDVPPADRFLQEYGFRHVDEVDFLGWQPLHLAAITGHVPAIQDLLRRRADINAASTRPHAAHLVFARTYPLNLACRLGSTVEAVRVLLDARASLEGTNTQGHTPLHAAGVAGRLDLAHLLLDYRADLDSPDRFGFVPMHVASMFGQTAMVEFLLAAGTRINAHPLRFDFLHLAGIFNNEGALVKTLLRGHCDPNLKVTLNWGSTLGFILSSAGVMYRLGNEHELAFLGYHASGATPLMFAAMYGNWNHVTALLEARANPFLRNDRGCTAAEIATKMGVPDDFITTLRDPARCVDGGSNSEGCVPGSATATIV